MLDIARSPLLIGSPDIIACMIVMRGPGDPGGATGKAQSMWQTIRLRRMLRRDKSALVIN